MFSLAADIVVLFHVAFVAFVVLGGLLVWRWRWVMWLHLPAVVWGILIEYAGWICPLTPLENLLRERTGEARYAGDFIARYLLPLLYPVGLTRVTQVALGTFALAVNLIVYWAVLRRQR